MRAQAATSLARVLLQADPDLSACPFGSQICALFWSLLCLQTSAHPGRTGLLEQMLTPDICGASISGRRLPPQFVTLDLTSQRSSKGLCWLLLASSHLSPLPCCRGTCGCCFGGGLQAAGGRSLLLCCSHHGLWAPQHAPPCPSPRVQGPIGTPGCNLDPNGGRCEGRWGFSPSFKTSQGTWHEQQQPWAEQTLSSPGGGCEVLLGQGR